MIEIKNLCKRYGSNWAIKDLNFSVHRGEILGFLGPNGAGKSTTMNVITGYISSTSGSAKIDGHDIMDEPLQVKKLIGYLPENPPLYLDMTVIEYLDFASDLKLVNKTIKKQQIESVLELVKISDVRNRLINNLSKGYKQRVGLAQALIGNPLVLILDEPTAGLDPKQIIEMRNLIKSLGGERTIILSSHILPEVSAICDRIVIINKGQIAAIDTPENLISVFEPVSKVMITAKGDEEVVISEISKLEGVSNIRVIKKENDAVFSYEIDYDKNVDIKEKLFFALANIGVPIIEQKTISASLEDIFLQITTNEFISPKLDHKDNTEEFFEKDKLSVSDDEEHLEDDNLDVSDDEDHLENGNSSVSDDEDNLKGGL